MTINIGYICLSLSLSLSLCVLLLTCTLLVVLVHCQRYNSNVINDSTEYHTHTRTQWSLNCQRW